MKKILFLTMFISTIWLSGISVLANDSYVTLERVNFRTAPSMDAEVLETVNPGADLSIEGESDGWYRVVYQGSYGYMKTEFVGSPDELQNTGSRTGNVELIPWSEARNVFTVGVPAEVLDIRTGLTYYVKSFSNGNHADVEPITQQDTNVMFRTYNGSWSWDTRPILVTINGRTMAASINGMPHGGGVNQSNGMDGQVCIHFKGSTTHNGSTYHEWDHQNSVMEAYNSTR